MSKEETRTPATEQSDVEGNGQVSAAEDLLGHGVPPEEVELAEARRLGEELIAQLSPADQEEIRGAQRQLEARGAEVLPPVVKWWGFEIHLNAEAAELAAEITELIGKIVSKVPKLKPIAPLIKAVVKLRAKWIREVGKTYGCKLVSPWIAPGMLIPISLRSKDDPGLWWTVLGTAGGWSEDQRFAAHYTAANPALAEFQGKLVCMHRGNSDSRLWWTIFDPDTGWSEDRQLPNHATASGPALAVFKNELYCVHRGDRDNDLWWTKSSDGINWTADRKFPNHRSGSGPALAVFQNKLYCVHRGNTGSGGDNYLWWTSTSDGVNWSADQRFPGHLTDSNPALAVYQNRLYCVHRGNGSSSMWWTSTGDGRNWTPDAQIPNAATREGPALAVFNNLLHCVHRGGADTSLWGIAFDGRNWTRDIKFPGHHSTQGPALITYRDKNGTEDQLLCVHRGSKS
ncbi:MULTISPECIES: hypothetical protein [unclassified Nonomuraea]|uniref:hypothetical protein n=1 Tax=unclassified Nonomuraea TaxID=2593643 RepID=UPI0033DB25E0